MGLRSYIIKRTLYSLALVYFVITLNFIIFQLMPGNPIEMFINPKLTKEQTDSLMKQWGLDQPVHLRYISYVSNMFTLQFGVSYRTRLPVGQEISTRLGNTVLLLGTATLLSLIVGIILGVVAAYKRGGLFDTGSVVASLTTYSLPTFWMGMVFIIIFYSWLHVLPIAGPYPYEWDERGWPQPLQFSLNPLVLNFNPSDLLTLIVGRLSHLFLPVLTLFLFEYGGFLLLTRATMMESLSEDYILTAKAKGLKERTILFKHALKNASLPLITSAALSFAFMISGAIITEQVFTWPGLGGWTWESIAYYDYPALQAIFFLIALCVIVANFISDLLYGIIDPRIKYG